MSRGDVWLRAMSAVLVYAVALMISSPQASCSHLSSHLNEFGRGSALFHFLADPYNTGSHHSVYDNLDEVTFGHPDLADVLAAKRASDKNFLRFGRGLTSKNFIRFGRGDGPTAKNFLRFGRSISRDDTASTDRFLEQESSKQLPRNKDVYFSKPTHRIETNEDLSESNFTSKDSSQRGRNRRSISSADSRHKFGSATTKQRTPLLRSKRAVPSLFLNSGQSGLFSSDWPPHDDDMNDFSYGEGSSSEEDENLSSQTIQDIQKRTFPRNFSRYGREPSDLNFIRFGKRGSDEDGSDSSESKSHERFMSIADILGQTEGAEAVLRARNNKNFLRYGRR